MTPDPIKGDRFKSFDPEGTGVWIAEIIWEDGTIYIESEGNSDARPR